MEIINKEADIDNKIASRYSIVIAAAKRARQIIDGGAYDAGALNTDKAVSIAIDEIRTGKIKIFPDGSIPGEQIGSGRPARAGRGVPGVGIDETGDRSSIIDYDEGLDGYFDDDIQEGDTSDYNEGFGDSSGEFESAGYEYGEVGDDYDDGYDYGDDDGVGDGFEG
jgi:DNA-directed RNA polymerase subunit omega